MQRLDFFPERVFGLVIIQRERQQIVEVLGRSIKDLGIEPPQATFTLTATRAFIRRKKVDIDRLLNAKMTVDEHDGVLQRGGWGFQPTAVVS